MPSILEKFSGVSRLESRLAAAVVDRDIKKAALDNLLTEDQDGAPVLGAEEAYAAAERRVLSLQSALAAAKAKHATEQVDAAQQTRRNHAQKTVTLAEERHKAIERLAKSAAVFAEAYNNALKINSDLLAQLPPHDALAALTDRASLETALRRELVRLGLPWSIQWAWGAVSIPPLVPQFEGALSVLRNLLSKDLQ